MTFAEYQQQAARTRDAKQDATTRTLISALGLAGEVGEVVELIKKEFGHGKPRDTGELAKELGDVLWYLADTATNYGLDLGLIAEANIAKLKERYPKGFV